jgi:pimeloyl-ACP methyl ester carboxylesterase
MDGRGGRVLSTDGRHSARPSRFFLALEGRAWLELAWAAGVWPWLLRVAQRGDDHPVLVLPGWLASDTSTRFVRRYLRELGYRAHGWRIGRNAGPTTGLARALERRLRGLVDRYGEPLTLIGWSLGGIYAHELARRYPADVRNLITLASPLQMSHAETVSAVFTQELGDVPGSPAPASATAGARPVPTTALYSRSDGIVPWRSCLAQAGPRAESIELPSSHFGMGHHPAALWVIANRLAQPSGIWRPLEPDGLVPRILGVRRGRVD